jgi:tetratricopeptide (TPR) repeat protein
MGFRFFKRMKVLPGVTLNLSKSGGSFSVGPQGARLTVGQHGARVSLGIPGSGLYYTTNFSLSKLGKLFGKATGTEESAETGETQATTEASSSAKSSPPQQSGQVKPDDIEKGSVPEDQKPLAAGCKALAGGKEDEALALFRQTTHVADGAFLAGVLALKKGQLDEAVRDLTAAAGKEQELGKQLATYGINATMSLAVTEEVTAHIEPSARGVLLALAETYQAQGKQSDAIACLERLQKMSPDDLVVKVSLAELLVEGGPGDHATLQKVVHLTEGVANESATHAALLLFKAQALRGLGLIDAAQDVLTSTLRRQKDRPAELLRALRYERGIVYESQGQAKKARSEFEKIYAEDPDYEDVAARLNIEKS